MKRFKRIFTFGLISGLLWSVVPGVLANLFSTFADVPATMVAGVSAGMVTFFSLAWLITRMGRTLSVVLGMLSLPFGAFVFGFILTLIDRFLPTLTSGSRAMGDPWERAGNYALFSVISLFAMVLFPLAVITTLLLRAFLMRGKDLEKGVW